MREVAIATAPLVSATLPVFLVGALAVQLRRDLNFDEAALGVLIASARVTTVVASGPGGWLAQRTGSVVSLRGGALAAGCLMLGAAWLSNGWATLVPFIALSGAAATVTESAADLRLTETVTARRGLAFGAKQSAGPVAALLAGLAVPAFAVNFGWRPTFAMAGLLAVGVATVAVPRRDARGRDARTRVTREGDIPLSLLALLSIGFGLGGFAASALTGFFVSGAVAAGFSTATAGLVYAVFATVSIGVRLVLGHQADIRTTSLILEVAAMMCVGALGFLMMASHHQAIFLVGAFLAFTAGWGWPGLFVLAIIRANPSAPAVGTAYARIGGFAGTILGPTIFGAVARSSYPAAWSLIAAVSVAAAIVLALSRRRAVRVLARPSEGPTAR